MSGLAGQHDPFAGTIDLDPVRKAARFRPLGRLQDTHEQVLLRSPVLSTDQAGSHSEFKASEIKASRIAASAELRVANRRKLADTALPAIVPHRLLFHA
jgi:hypothetical protein